MSQAAPLCAGRGACAYPSALKRRLQNTFQLRVESFAGLGWPVARGLGEGRQLLWQMPVLCGKQGQERSACATGSACAPLGRAKQPAEG